jgi:hypothetical protein
MNFVASPHPSSATRHIIQPRVAGVSSLDPAICGAYPHHSLAEWIQKPGEAATCQKCIQKAKGAA